MRRRYLFGPVAAPSVADALADARRDGECLVFGPAGAADLTLDPRAPWEALLASLPAGWRPDFVVLHLPPAAPVPVGLFAAPIPVVAVAGAWRLRWHHYLRVLPRCDLVLADAAGAEKLNLAGLTHARPARLVGRSVAPDPAPERDIDVLFVSGLRGAADRDELPWAGRVAALADRWRVAVRRARRVEDYHPLLPRARVVVTRPGGDDPGRLAAEAAAAGALVFIEAGDPEAFPVDPSPACVPYNAETLEDLLGRYLGRDEERARVAEAGRVVALQGTAERRWAEVIGTIGWWWDDLRARAARRQRPTPEDELITRGWQSLGPNGPSDPDLVRDLVAAAAARPDSAPVHNALGLAVAGPTRGKAAPARTAALAAEHFARAAGCDPDNVAVLLNHAEALAAAEQTPAAVAAARDGLARLDRAGGLSPAALVTPHYPPGTDLFRVEWERAAWSNAGQPAAEAGSKRDLVAWRLHGLLARLTGDVHHRYESALARPDLPGTRATLGSALLHAGRPADAVPHLRLAVAGNPFDGAAAHALYESLRAAGRPDEAGRLAAARRLLGTAAGDALAPEPWAAADAGGTGASPSFVSTAPLPAARPRPAPGRPRVSLCMIVRNEEGNLPACVGPVRDLFDEVVVVDTGSTDRTKDVARELGAKVFDFPWCDSFAAARNESLRHATGDWAFWLDADDRVDDANRDRLKVLFASLPDEPAAYLMNCLCPNAAGGPGVTVAHARLFRLLPGVRWRYRVHEQILLSVHEHGGVTRHSDVAVRHEGYRDPALYQGKLERNHRLLALDAAATPDDAFVRFYEGYTLMLLGRHAEAVPLLRHSRACAPPGMSIIPKTHALLGQCLVRLGRRAEALDACRAGLRTNPTDTELLFLEANLLQEAGDHPAAEGRLRALLGAPAETAYSGLDAGLRGYKVRHNLAVLYRDQKRYAEAEAEWQAALAEEPGFGPAWVGLGELHLAQGRDDGVQRALEALERAQPGGPDAAVLRARWLARRGDVPAARAELEAVAARDPRAVGPRLALGRLLARDGRDPGAAEKVFREVLALEPGNAEAERALNRLPAR